MIKLTGVLQPKTLAHASFLLNAILVVVWLTGGRTAPDGQVFVQASNVVGDLKSPAEPPKPTLKTNVPAEPALSGQHLDDRLSYLRIPMTLLERSVTPLAFGFDLALTDTIKSHLRVAPAEATRLDDALKSAVRELARVEADYTTPRIGPQGVESYAIAPSFETAATILERCQKSFIEILGSERGGILAEIAMNEPLLGGTKDTRILSWRGTEGIDPASRQQNPVLEVYHDSEFKWKRTFPAGLSHRYPFRGAPISR